MEYGSALEAYTKEIAKGHIKDVLDIGTKRVKEEAPTHGKRYYNYPVNYVMTDMQDGLDVDIISNAHTMSTVFGCNSFDAIYSDAVFEHIEKPWLASQEMYKVLRPGGVFYHRTVFIFAEHWYPSDYFRYTQFGLRSVFDWATDIETNYNHQAKIISGLYPEGQSSEIWQYVSIFGRKSCT